MSILKKPYEISVWDDVWNADEGKFEEKLVGIIGTDSMLYQGRALEPNLVRNVNGTKSFSFKMYKSYIDVTTGERENNLFSDWLINERKVKLKYGTYIDENGEEKPRWYDFVVKNVGETSVNYLYTYQLGDALVQELSKNGFGVTLDAELQNNLGNVEKLASFVMSETDWGVEAEKFVEKVEEELVYVKLPNQINKQIHLLKDQSDLNQGIDDVVYSNSLGGKTVLAFYSSCTNKPHRFQFIYLPDYTKDSVSINNRRIIQNSNCQYYIEFEPNEYSSEPDDKYNLTLPNNFQIFESADNIEDENDTTISTWYRGNRYGFAQQAVYVPLLERYCNVYSKQGEEYYGYVDSEYNTPVFTQNLITGYEFKSKSGWIGTFDTDGANADLKNKTEVENVFGRFGTKEGVKSFISSTDDLLQKNFPYGNDLSSYSSYLQFKIKATNSLLLNSCIYDNRTLLGNLNKGDKLAFYCKILDAAGEDATEQFNFSLAEYSYDTVSGGYGIRQSETEILFDNGLENYKSSYSVVEVLSSDYSEDTFKDSKIMLAIIPAEGTPVGEYYIEKIELFTARYNDNNELIKLDEQGSQATNAKVNKQYSYFPKSALENIKSKEELTDIEHSDVLSYSTYIPIYNIGAEKVRAVSVRESNYFNILQSIAETFQCWLELEVSRDNLGGITSKTVRFKNYAGKTNYAAFRYGVNLRDITRANDSTNIVTKLIVKQNNNELAESGFCTIARAPINPTGESYIYDFQYYQNKGLMNANDFVKLVYKTDGAEGADRQTVVEGSLPTELEAYTGRWNLKGYYLRLRDLNKKIQDENKLLSGVAQELVSYQAKLQVATANKQAANKGIEETREDFYRLTGIYPDQASKEIKETTIENLSVSDENYQFEASRKAGSTTVYEITLKRNGTDEDELPYEKASIVFDAIYYFDEENYVKKQHTRNFAFESEQTEAIVEFDGSEAIDTSKGDVLNYLTKFTEYQVQENTATAEEADCNQKVTAKQTLVNNYKKTIEIYTDYKRKLNQLFYSRYSRFIQEGTWISEEHVDDNKYYTDSQSVLYSSCYPQVAYTINTLALGQLPGYEMFEFELGDETFAEDEEFFGLDENGNPVKQSVIISEITENLDDPSKNVNKVQTFKDQFQDLFQKITATTQQVQYNSGAYERGAAEVEAINADKGKFLQDTLDGMTDGVDIKNARYTSSNKDGTETMLVIDGKILFAERDNATNTLSWKTGLSSQGISANKITAGTINTGEIQIMSSNEPAFKWDEYGITAFNSEEFQGVQSGFDETKFVRFDKHGIYGIEGKDGSAWHPQASTSETANEVIDREATFALTWEGLKVTGEEGVVARIGKTNSGILEIIRTRNDPHTGKSVKDNLMSFTNDGTLKVGGWKVSQDGLENGGSPSGTGAMKSRTALPEVFLTSAPRQRSVKGFVSTEGEDDVCEGIVFKAGEQFMVSERGTLYANNAVIRGKILANSGYIGGWRIADGDLKTDGAGLITSDNWKLPSSIINGQESGVRFYSGNRQWKITARLNYEIGDSDSDDKDGVRPMSFVIETLTEKGKQNIEVKQLISVNGDVFQIDSLTKPTILSVTRYGQPNWDNAVDLKEAEEGYWGGGPTVAVDSTDLIIEITPLEGGTPVTYLLADGSFSTSAANIHGHVEAETGKIAGFNITNEEYHDKLAGSDTGQPAVLRYIANEIQSPSAEYNGEEFGSIEIISRDDDGSRLQTTLNSIGFEQAYYEKGELRGWSHLTYDTLSLGPQKNYTDAFSGIRLSADRQLASIIFGSTMPAAIASLNTSEPFTISSNNEIELSVAGKKIKVSDLLFKGPYAIKYGSASGTQIGRIYQIGQLVYGAIKPYDAATTNVSLYICKEGTNTTVSIPGPVAGQTLNYVILGTKHTTIEISSNSNKNLTMKTGSTIYQPVGNMHGNWTYFCYCISNSSWHPTAS